MQEPSPCGWSEVFAHFMMGVIQARCFSVFFLERYGISKFSYGECRQEGFMAVGFWYRPFVAYLAVLGRLPIEQWLMGNLVRCSAS